MKFSLKLDENNAKKPEFIASSPDILRNNFDSLSLIDDFKKKPIILLNQGKINEVKSSNQEEIGNLTLLENHRNIDRIFRDLDEKLLCIDTLSNFQNSGEHRAEKEVPCNSEVTSTKICEYICNDYFALSKTSQSSSIKKDFKRSKSSSPRKPLKLKENMNQHNLFNISRGVESMKNTISDGISDIKASSPKKVYTERETSPKKPWTPQRIILKQENESLKKYISELKEKLEESEKNDENDTNYDVNDNTVKRLRELVDFVQTELTIYLEVKNLELDKLQKEFENMKSENEKLKERNLDLLRMWELEKERVKRREKQLGMEQMKNKQIIAQMGMLEEAIMTKETLSA
ncbi:unnamed protein product [Pneumocystis jirovecii]|uniref:Uncharacterized protein n=1 Tax=Pneumocystis jirovecii TaxID=42068 RepID=L0PAD7_PNEJI|nr:unnamed protein product [Pneumocystis jirovecii]CCJ31430.1 unnamed protein product [Pneumocystis jirovecii]